MELIVYAPVWGQSGFEQLSRGLLTALDQMGVNIELRPALDWNQEIVGLSENTLSRLKRMVDTRVTPYSPTVIYQLPKGQPIHPNAPTICYTLFETDRVPSPWVHNLLQMDKIFVFSQFNKAAWSQSGIPENKLYALPPAVDSFLYNPNGPRMEISNKKGFVFLTSGDFTERKNFEGLIEAYVTEFTTDENVTLILKCHFGGFTKKYRRSCVQKIKEMADRFNPKSAPRMLFYGDKISDCAMAALYRSADCFVLTSRGEGLGMQYLEAMASGIPVISSDWGAQTDFLDETNSFLVKSHLKTIDDPNYILKCPQALNSKWCQIDIDDLRKKMRFVFGGYEGKIGEEKERASRALKTVRRFTWHNMAIQFIRGIINLYAKEKCPQEVPV